MRPQPPLLLSTSRLLLSPFQSNPVDLEVFHSINTDRFVRRFLWDDESIDRQTAAQILRHNQQLLERDGYGLWKISMIATTPATSKGSEEQGIMGYAGLWHFFDDEPQPQLVYALLPPFTRQGYAVEAAQAVINYSFTQLDYDYLIAATDVANVASQNVAKKLGMKQVETTDKQGKPTAFFRIDRES